LPQKLIVRYGFPCLVEIIENNIVLMFASGFEKEFIDGIFRHGVLLSII
jgi:hypothetical protein